MNPTLSPLWATLLCALLLTASTAQAQYDYNYTGCLREDYRQREVWYENDVRVMVNTKTKEMWPLHAVLNDPTKKAKLLAFPINKAEFDTLSKITSGALSYCVMIQVDSVKELTAGPEYAPHKKLYLVSYTVKDGAYKGTRSRWLFTSRNSILTIQGKHYVQGFMMNRFTGYNTHKQQVEVYRDFRLDVINMIQADQLYVISADY